MAGEVLTQTAIGDYRQRPLEELQRLVPELRIITGAEYFDPTTRTRVTLPRSSWAKNHFFARRRLLWQSGVVLPAVRARVAMLELNPRIVSSWVVLIARRILRRRTVLWGHAWPRRGSRARSDHLRQAMRLLADEIVVYTETQAHELRTRMPRKPITAAPNGLYISSEIGVPMERTGGASDFLFVGRLVPAKKPQLALDAFGAFLDENPVATSRLVFVGDGPMLEKLRARSARFGDRVDFTGHIAEMEHLRPLFSRALATVSPGYVGLSLVQSLSFGVPMAVARDEPHSPEIEAAVEGDTALFFTSDSTRSMAAALSAFWKDRASWLSRRAAIADYARSRYSADLMAERLADAFRG